VWGHKGLALCIGELALAKAKRLASKRVRSVRVKSPVQLDWLVKEAYRDHTRPVRVHSNGKTLVVMTWGKYEGLIETLHLLRLKADQLLKSIEAPT
jgi:hypothetical protein